ncbi:hypothetical protein ACPDIX_14970 [Limisphaera sp. 4302-co]
MWYPDPAFYPPQGRTVAMMLGQGRMGELRGRSGSVEVLADALE